MELMTHSYCSEILRYSGDMSYLFLKYSSFGDPLREDPEFKDLLEEYRQNAVTQQQILQAINEN